MTVSTHVRPSRDISFLRNTVHDLPGPPGPSEDGFGIWVITGDVGPIRNVLIRGNRFSNLPNDGVQTDASNVRIEDNVFERIHSPDHDWSHADIIQSLGSNTMRIRGNFARDNDAGILTSTTHRSATGSSRTTSSCARSPGRCSSTTSRTACGSPTTPSGAAARRSCAGTTSSRSTGAGS